MDTLQPRFHLFHRWTQWGPKQLTGSGHMFQERRCVKCDLIEKSYV